MRTICQHGYLDECVDGCRSIVGVHDECLEKIKDRDAEIERLREDLVWAVQSGAWFCDGPETFIGNCDGTSDSICRAVREARDGV